VIKPYIGDDEHDITVKKAKTAVILTAVTSLLGFAITLALAALEIHL
jgi:predicted RND superfamily exporter protein